LMTDLLILSKLKMTTQEKINALTPFQQQEFITCDVEYDFSLCVNIWQREVNRFYFFLRR